MECAVRRAHGPRAPRVPIGTVGRLYHVIDHGGVLLSVRDAPSDASLVGARMLYVDKYRPRDLSELQYHPQLTEQLQSLVRIPVLMS